jgi:CBS domain-containing protein
VRDIMTRDVITINEEDNLTELARGMDFFRVRHLPVVSDDKLVGLISHRDMLRMAMSSLDTSVGASTRASRTLANTFAASVMTRDVATVAADTPIVDAVQLMLRTKFGCLPVVEADQRLIGLITEHDLLRELASLLEGVDTTPQD